MAQVKHVLLLTHTLMQWDWQALITGQAIPSSVESYPNKICMKDPGTWFGGTSRRRSGVNIDWDKVMTQVENWGKETFKGNVKSDVVTVLLWISRFRNYLRSMDW